MAKRDVIPKYWFKVPDSVYEFKSKMRELNASLRLAEKNWGGDGGSSYRLAIERKYEYYENTKEAWYKELSESESSGNKKRYNVLRKMIADAFTKYADGTTIKGGGTKSKIEIKIDEEGRKIAKRTLVKANSKGEKVTYELTLGLHEGRKRGWFELYATDEEGEEYFYSEGGLWIEGGKITDYDGVYELSEKLKPLMSALNLNSVEVYEEGGSILGNGGALEGVIDENDIKQGDYVDFESYGEFYVCNPSYSDNYFWVTKEKEDRYDSNAQGYSVPKSSAIEIIETDEEYANGGNMQGFCYTIGGL